jgi:hypothetical protein
MTEQECAEGTELKVRPANEAVAAAVAAARRLIVSLLHADQVPEAEMAEVADQLTAVADRLDARVPAMADRIAASRATPYREDAGRRDLVTGPQNAIAPPLCLRGKEDGSVSGAVTLGLPYQGPPGCVHGGVSALLLDHVLGAANYWAGPTGMTAELTLRYERPAPLFTPLTVTGRQLSVDGRKIRAAGAIYAEGKACVSAEGLFIAWNSGSVSR